MAETKSGQSRKSTRARPTVAAKPKASKKSRLKARAQSKSQKSRRAPAKASKNGGSNGIGDSAKAVRHAVGSAGKDAGQATAHAASKAKIPLLAGSAALLGAAGGLALGASRSGDKVLGIRMPASKRVKIRSSDIARAAKDVGHFGDRVGELTTEIRRVRQGIADGAADSPIEILLRGLTKPRR